MTSYAGTFRVGGREIMWTQYLRIKKKMSIPNIAKINKRSTSTIQHHVQFAEMGMQIDNRCFPIKTRSDGVINYMSKLNEMKVRFRLFISGVYETVEEALADKTVPLGALTLANQEESENTTFPTDDEPP